MKKYAKRRSLRRADAFIPRSYSVFVDYSLCVYLLHRCTHFFHYTLRLTLPALFFFLPVHLISSRIAFLPSTPRVFSTIRYLLFFLAPSVSFSRRGFSTFPLGLPLPVNTSSSNRVRKLKAYDFKKPPGTFRIDTRDMDEAAAFS